MRNKIIPLWFATVKFSNGQNGIWMNDNNNKHKVHSKKSNLPLFEVFYHCLNSKFWILLNIWKRFKSYCLAVNNDDFWKGKICARYSLLITIVGFRFNDYYYYSNQHLWNSRLWSIWLLSSSTFCIFNEIFTIFFHANRCIRNTAVAVFIVVEKNVRITSVQFDNGWSHISVFLLMLNFEWNIRRLANKIWVRLRIHIATDFR